jgi:hypothetical protein
MRSMLRTSVSAINQTEPGGDRTDYAILRMFVRTTKLALNPGCHEKAGYSLRIEPAKFHAPSGRGGERHAPANTPGIRHITFAVDDIDEVLARLQARGAELPSGASISTSRTSRTRNPRSF